MFKLRITNSSLSRGVSFITKESFEHTAMFEVQTEGAKAREVLLEIYEALKEKGHNPINQLVGYLLSGEPTYITSYGNARSLIRQIERDELLEELLKSYLKQNDIEIEAKNIARESE